MGHLLKRPDASSYVAQFKDGSGRWVKRSTGCSDKRAAALVLARYEREAAEQRGGAPAAAVVGAAANPAGVPANAPAHTVDEALGWLLDSSMANGKADGTVRMYVQKSGHLVRLLGHDRDVNVLTLDVVQAYVNDRHREGAALSTVSKELITLRAALSMARARRKFAGSVDEIMPKLNTRYVPRKRYLTTDELHALCAELEPHRALWVAVAVYTGARASEVAKLEWTDIHWTAPAKVCIRGTKTEGSDRVVPLALELARLLWPLRQAGGPVVGAWPNCRRDLAAACVRAGIARCSPNDLRRSFASWLKQRGVDSAVVAKLLGHSSTKMVDLVYGRLDFDTLAGAVALLSDGGRAGQGRDKGGTNSSGASGHGGQDEQQVDRDFPSVSEETVVPQGGIEPPTRGFSVRCSTS